MENFIPPANGASQGYYFLTKIDQILLHTERQTNSLTPLMGVCEFFLPVKFATSLLALLAGG